MKDEYGTLREVTNGQKATNCENGAGAIKSRQTGHGVLFQDSY